VGLTGKQKHNLGTLIMVIILVVLMGVTVWLCYLSFNDSVQHYCVGTTGVKILDQRNAYLYPSDPACP
jgi:hypothetical protein